MAPGGAGDCLVRTITQEGELSWEKCLAASQQKLLGEERVTYLATSFATLYFVFCVCGFVIDFRILLFA